ncbi:MAG: class I SAM-dependent methyltransferase [Moorea sp. SIO3C2]|nr:class I SAM-dependent methyltransferase [Moorena sp. SIO3C2]
MQNVDFEIQLPEIESTRNLPIQEEYFWLIQNGTKRRLRLHDYTELYQIPYLYEQIYQKVNNQSHIVLPSLLVEQFIQAGGTVEDMVVLDVGAGSGWVGKTLADLGVKSIVGIDIMPKAAELARQQYPGVYQNYYVEDLTNLSNTAREGLNSQQFNCLICSAALGFNHIPAQGWATAFNAIAPDGWIVFNVQKERWDDESSASFVAWHPWVGKTEIFEIIETHEYQHRFHFDGRPLYYVAIIGKKRGNIPES